MFDVFEKKIGGLVKKNIAKVQSKVKKLTNVKKISNKLFKTVFSKFRSLLGKPVSLDDYVKTGATYIAKRIIVLVVLLVMGFLFLFNWFLLPWAEGRIWIPEIVINSDKFHGYTGKAMVVTSGGNLVYMGELEDGRITGEGSLYNEEGFLVYRGYFINENYHGIGERFSPDGNLLYQGEFADNLYEGNGQLFHRDALLYEGEFKGGLFHGEGRLYEGEKLLYEGQFSNGKFEGTGRLYENGQLLYEGQFENNYFHGEGNKYHSNENLKYSGSFSRGEKNGDGKLFNEEEALIYQGSFVDGLYEGIGVQFNAETGRIIYEGTFRQGEYHGLGSLYDQELGRLLYDGHFRAGLFDGQGSLYSWKGQNIYDGPFYKGDIDYFSFIDSPVTMVREAFGTEDDVAFFQHRFHLEYEQSKVIFSLDYPDEELPMVKKIIFLGEQVIAGGHAGLSMDELPSLYGESCSEFYFLVDEEKGMVLQRLGIRDMGGLHSVRYILNDEVFMRFYALDLAGKVLYFEMGGL